MYLCLLGTTFCYKDSDHTYNARVTPTTAEANFYDSPCGVSQCRTIRSGFRLLTAAAGDAVNATGDLMA